MNRSLAIAKSDIHTTEQVEALIAAAGGGGAEVSLTVDSGSTPLTIPDGDGYYVVAADSTGSALEIDLPASVPDDLSVLVVDVGFAVDDSHLITVDGQANTIGSSGDTTFDIDLPGGVLHIRTRGGKYLIVNQR